MGPELHDTVWIICGTIFFLGMNLFIMQSKYYKLFLNPKLQWWRTAPRYSKRFKIMLLKGRDRFESKTLDISRTGAFIQDDITLCVGERCIMSIYLNNIAVVKGECKVVRKGIGAQGYTGFGLNFDKLNKVSKELLTQHLNQIVA